MVMKPFDLDILLDCYRRGVFPMAESRCDSTIFLVDPDRRGVIPLDGLHVSRSLRKFMRRMPFTITFDRCFEDVVTECARPTPDRQDTWINSGILFLYSDLHRTGSAHSVEVWLNDRLIGGLYGVSIGAAFFGESMFSRQTNASKVALVKLVERLNAGGYRLLDTQFVTDHLKTLGAVEISRAEYHKLLKEALANEARFYPNS
ncbi:MAG: leucyl/phenylalanyl-tRNA--protein transferase [Hyphomonadaceae bacterium]|nr:leucyl/phenylalanyl-tRNA--protein transferase [Hyphomonadaceae bacterium]MBC6412005.1 leucyl/phenylalanyl-tRNA--protein transferase [Hyphomonadaceae bacterium]